MRRRRTLVLLMALAGSLLMGGGLSAQAVTSVTVEGPDGERARAEVATHRGYPAVSAGELAEVLGPVEEALPVYRLPLPDGGAAEFVLGSPFVRIGDRLHQLAHVPYRFSGHLHLPLQFYVHLLPGERGGDFRWDPSRSTLELTRRVADGSGPEGTGSLDALNLSPRAEAAPLSRVVIIDPGHGGDDTGARGPGGTLEKDVALDVARALERRLAEDPTIEVRLTRESDVHVPLWERGEMATRWKEDRGGVFVSIHANSTPERSSARGFETYFLSEARTEHERRVAAVENAPLGLERDGDGPAADPLAGGDGFLDHILRDLRNFDHQHWSALLARQIQSELARVHPGPDRGVKQGPFAVITNALMPAVLVEVGFLSNPEEERLLTDARFHDEVAEALAHAIREFLDRYPPGATAQVEGGP